MTEVGYISIYTTYDKSMAVALISALRENDVKMIYRTSTETGSEDVLYEVCVQEENIDNAHEILLNLKTE
ncbi:MAG: hypothetical protein R3232_12725 [Clostridia bacterium]|nr:hypothetical protein [Clostridia bacterium]